MFVFDLFVIILSVISIIVLGMLWYSPLMFMHEWMKSAGITSSNLNKAKAKGMKSLYFMNFLMSLAQAFIVYVLFLHGFELLSIFAIWIGFSMPVYALPVMWEGKPWKLFFINAGYGLVSMAFMFEIIYLFLS